MVATRTECYEFYKRDNNFLMSFTRQFFHEAETINLSGFVVLCCVKQEYILESARKFYLHFNYDELYSQVKWKVSLCIIELKSFN